MEGANDDNDNIVLELTRTYPIEDVYGPSVWQLLKNE